MEMSNSPKEIRFYRAIGPFGFLSNLWPAPIMIQEKPWDWRNFASSEHVYQFGIAKDLTVADWLAKAPFPDVCATSAHSLLRFRVRDNSDEIKEPVMRKALWEKYKQNRDLHDLLLKTKGCRLIESSKSDNFWGIGKGAGKNRLGELQMELRDMPTEFLANLNLYDFEKLLKFG